MGIGFVLLLWLIIGIIAATVGAIILAGGAAILTRKAQAGRGKAILLSAALPFIGLCWWAGVFVFQAAINIAVFHHDPGLGDYWGTPLPNGYFLTMIDVTEHGWVSRNTEGEMGPPISQLQVSDRYILGRYEDTKQPTPYFLLDSATDKWRTFGDPEALRAAAKPLSITPALEPIAYVYSRYRNTWFDYFVVLLFLGYPVGALIFWVRQIRRLRRGPALAVA